MKFIISALAFFLQLAILGSAEYISEHSSNRLPEQVVTTETATNRDEYLRTSTTSTIRGEPSYNGYDVESAFRKTTTTSDDSAAPSSTPSARPSSAPTTTPSAGPSAMPSSFADACCMCDMWAFIPSFELMTFYGHMMAAQAMGCGLASVNSEAEQIQLISALQNMDETITTSTYPAAYIGLMRPPMVQDPMNGGVAGEWEWIDGCVEFTDASYENWEAGQPDNANGGEFVVAARFEDLPVLGLWNDYEPSAMLPAVYKCCLPPRSAETCVLNM